MSDDKTLEQMGKAAYIVWVDHGCEGWHPYPYASLEVAMRHEGYGSAKFITKPVRVEVRELPDG